MRASKSCTRLRRARSRSWPAVTRHAAVQSNSTGRSSIQPTAAVRPHPGQTSQVTRSLTVPPLSRRASRMPCQNPTALDRSRTRCGVRHAHPHTDATQIDIVVTQGTTTPTQCHVARLRMSAAPGRGAILPTKRRGVLAAVRQGRSQQPGCMSSAGHRRTRWSARPRTSWLQVSACGCADVACPAAPCAPAPTGPPRSRTSLHSQTRCARSQQRRRTAGATTSTSTGTTSCARPVPTSAREPDRRLSRRASAGPADAVGPRVRPGCSNRLDSTEVATVVSRIRAWWPCVARCLGRREARVSRTMPPRTRIPRRRGSPRVPCRCAWPGTWRHQSGPERYRH